MTIRQRLHDLADAIRDYPYRNAQDTFSRLNPTLNGLHPNALIDHRAAHALEDEHDRQDAFTQLNPDVGVLPDARDPEQHRFAQQRERALALGQRVAAAERPARERGEPSALARIARPPAERQGAER